MLGVVVACAVLQAWLVFRFGGKFEFQSRAFQLWPALIVTARRLFLWPVLGNDWELGLAAKTATPSAAWCSLRSNAPVVPNNNNSAGVTAPGIPA